MLCSPCRLAHCYFHFPAVCSQSCARVPDLKGWRILSERLFTTARKGYGKPVRLRRSESERPSVLFVDRSKARNTRSDVPATAERKSAALQDSSDLASPQVGGCSRTVCNVSRIVELERGTKILSAYTHVSYDQCTCVYRCAQVLSLHASTFGRSSDRS